MEQFQDWKISDTPEIYPELLVKCKQIGFDMSSDLYIGTLLKSLVASKLNANILELGTGPRLSLSWMVEGLDNNSKITSIDNDPDLINIAQEFFGADDRVSLHCTDGAR